jgi:hypothetical protein
VDPTAVARAQRCARCVPHAPSSPQRLRHLLLVSSAPLNDYCSKDT